MWEALMSSAEPWAWARLRALYQAVMMTPMMAPPTVATSSDYSHWRAWWRRSFQMSVTMIFSDPLLIPSRSGGARGSR